MGRRKDEEEEVSPEEMDADLKEALLEDTEFKKYRNILKQVEKRIDLDDVLSEAKRLHSGRKARTLTRVPKADDLLEAQLQDGGNRARLSQIMAELVEQTGIVDDALTAIRAHIATTYSSMIPSARTKAERVVYVNKYLRKGVKMQSKMEVCSKIL
jgi:chromatin segregation and condensation protein Rec8/ScpA/Scc1 (kleisin family)